MSIFFARFASIMLSEFSQYLLSILQNDLFAQSLRYA
jgi:hypothetical protein